MVVEAFGKTADGQDVQRIALSGGGLRAWILTYGSIVQDLRLEGHMPPLVLGFDAFAPYLTHSPYFGATAGRCANRIRDGHLDLDGTTYQLDRNFIGKHCLHGGSASIGKRLWQIDSVADDSVTLVIALDDGEMGFPGNMLVHVTYSLLPGGIFDICMLATTDKITLCNLAHHSYFNLDGLPTVAEHQLQVKAGTYLPVDDELIPTGEIRAVDGTGFDFRQPRHVNTTGEGGLLDHNFCLSPDRTGLRRVARLHSEVSGVAMDVKSTEPGVQVYDGAKIDIGLPGLIGNPMRAHAGIALEPQVWPDANHHDHFPQAILRPGEGYRQHTQYIFSKD